MPARDIDLYHALQAFTFFHSVFLSVADVNMLFIDASCVAACEHHTTCNSVFGGIGPYPSFEPTTCYDINYRHF